MDVWRFGLVVTLSDASTKLLYVKGDELARNRRMHNLFVLHMDVWIYVDRKEEKYRA